MIDTVFNIVASCLVFAFGASIGSFLNVVAFRLPLGRSVVRPGSSCPRCGKSIPWYALLPVVGYFLILGRCVCCKGRVSLRYPLVEFLTGAFTVGAVLRYGTPLDLWLTLSSNDYASYISLDGMRYQVFGSIITALWVLYTGMVLTLIDIDHRILPDVITLPGTIVGIALGSINPQVGFVGSLLGVAVGAGGIYLIAKAYELVRHREGMGFGDVKYLGFIGAAVGWQGVIWVVAIASIVGAIVGMVVIFVRKKSMAYALPFGPFLALAALLVALWGEEIRLFVYPPM